MDEGPSDAPDPASRIHRAYNEEVRRRHRKHGWPGLLTLRALLWPLRAATLALAHTWRRGAVARAVSGKGAVRQWIEQMELALRSGIPPKSYFGYRLYDDARRAEAAQYLHRFETKHNGVFKRLNRKVGRSDGALTDKREFHTRCRAHGLATPAVLLELRKGVVEPVESAEPTLPAMDLFVKPAKGKGGRSIERWDHVPGLGFRRADDGKTLTGEALLERLREASKRERLIVQPRLVNHAGLADLSSGAMATVRILSCWDEQGVGEPTIAVFRMAVDSSSIDNFHAGGIAAAVDFETGQLGRAADLDPNSDWHEVHPRTGAKILGRQLPYWPELLDLVRRAHAVFDHQVIAGWDVGLTDDGPVLVEGNTNPCVHLIQRPHDAPLGRTQLAELIAYHLDHGAKVRKARKKKRPVGVQQTRSTR